MKVLTPEDVDQWYERAPPKHAPLTMGLLKPMLIVRIISGDTRFLWNALAWADTPQGHDYWHARAERWQPLSDEDRAYLEQVRTKQCRICQERTDARIEGGYIPIWSPKHLFQVMSGDRPSLSDAFHWASTPQGHDHWRRHVEGFGPFPRKDRAFIEQLYAEIAKRKLGVKP